LTLLTSFANNKIMVNIIFSVSRVCGKKRENFRKKATKTFGKTYGRGKSEAHCEAKVRVSRGGSEAKVRKMREGASEAKVRFEGGE
jgi:hypothetical protein